MSARTLLVALAAATVFVGMGAFAAPASTTASTDELIEQMTEVGRQVPPFGGAFVEDGTLKIWVLETPTHPVEEAAEQARTALADVAGMDYSADQVEILAADYSWANLVWWYERLPFALSAVPAVADHDIDIEANRLRVVVDDVSANQEDVVAELERSDIPTDAVEIVEGSAGGGLANGSGALVGLLAVVLVTLLIVILLTVRRRNRSSIGTTVDTSAEE